VSILLIFKFFFFFADATPTPPHPGLLLRRETETERKRSLSLSLALPPSLSVICLEIDLSSPATGLIIMLRFLKGVVGGASGTGLKDLPYNIGDPYPSAWGSWTHHRGTSSKVRVSHPLLFSFSLYLSVTYDA